MKIQRDKYSCGPVAIVNALRALGIKVPERRVRAHTASKKGQGTTEHGIRNALERLDFTTVEMTLDSSTELDFQHLYAQVSFGNPVLLHVDGDHWIAAIGVMGPLIIVFDSENIPENKSESGVYVYNARQLCSRWKRPRYGIIIQRNPTQ